MSADGRPCNDNDRAPDRRSTTHSGPGMSNMNSTLQSSRSEPRRSARRTALAIALALAAFASGQQDAIAGPREQAKRMYDRLTGTPPSQALLDDLAARIQPNDMTSRVNAAMYMLDPANARSK